MVRCLKVLFQFGTVLILPLGLQGCGGSSKPPLSFAAPVATSTEPVTLSAGSLDGVLLIDSAASELKSSDGLVVIPLIPSVQN